MSLKSGHVCAMQSYARIVLPAVRMILIKCFKPYLSTFCAVMNLSTKKILLDDGAIEVTIEPLTSGGLHCRRNNGRNNLA